jgi:hypothetical protein
VALSGGLFVMAWLTLWPMKRFEPPHALLPCGALLIASLSIPVVAGWDAMRRRVGRQRAGLLGVLLVAVILTYLAPSFAAQLRLNRQLDEGKAFARRLEDKVNKDERLRNVAIVVATSGHVSVVGDLDSQEAAARLNELVAQSAPTQPVELQVRVPSHAGK